jgi:hypothetical protein
LIIVEIVIYAPMQFILSHFYLEASNQRVTKKIELRVSTIIISISAACAFIFAVKRIFVDQEKAWILMKFGGNSRDVGVAIGVAIIGFCLWKSYIAYDEHVRRR